VDREEAAREYAKRKLGLVWASEAFLAGAEWEAKASIDRDSTGFSKHLKEGRSVPVWKYGAIAYISRKSNEDVRLEERKRIIEMLRSDEFVKEDSVWSKVDVADWLEEKLKAGE